MYPLVLELAVDGVPDTVTRGAPPAESEACGERVLKFSKQGFCQWLMNPVTQRDWDDAHLTNAAWDAHQDDPAFGYRFIADELHHAGLKAGENRVWRLCSQQRLWPVFAKKRGLRGNAGPPVHDDHVQRNFTANRPNQLWLTDIPPPGACGGRCPHRASHRRGQNLSLRDQGRVVEQDRWLLHRLADESVPGGRGGPQRDQPMRRRRHDSALRQRVASRIRPVEERRHRWVDGPGRRVHGNAA